MTINPTTMPSGVSSAFEVFGRDAGAHAAAWMNATHALEAACALDPKTKNITGTRDYHYVRKWLDDYCKANPTMYFGEAVRMLIEELYPARIPNTPDQEPKPGEGVVIHFK